MVKTSFFYRQGHIYPLDVFKQGPGKIRSRVENVGTFRAIFPLKIWSHRWNMCVEWTNKKMGMAVGSLFVQDHFNHESKVVALEMIHGIREGELRMLSTFIL
jgi:hypothetical protein